MPTETQTGALCIESEGFLDEELPTVVDVRHVSMVFNMASQQLNSLKEYAIALLRRELMFKEFRALNDISFEVKKGDVFGILGTNGSGKSTLLKIISGVLTPTEGSVEIQGKIAPLIELAAGFDMELTGRENIFLNGSLLGHSKKYIEQHFDAIVEFAEIEDFLDMPLKNYSSGMVSRIAFAIATVMIPDILIVDEVLSVGDFMFQEKCEARIQDLIHNHGVTVLIVSHSIDQIERLCNKAIWIEKSHPRLIGEAKTVASIYRMLGGHSGSKESENVILELFQNDVSSDDIVTKTIASKSKYDTALDILELCDFGDAVDAVIVNGDVTEDKLIALGVGGALSCPVLNTRGDELIERVKQNIRYLGIKNVIVVDGGGNIAPAVFEELKSIRTAHGSVDITTISANNVDGLSQAAAVYLNKRGIGFDWFRAERDQEFDLAMLSSVIYKNGALILYNDPSCSIEHTEAVPVVPRIQDRSKTPGLFGSLGSYLDSLDAMLQLGGERATQTERELVLVSSHDPSDCLASSVYIAQHHADLVAVNHSNLDSLANAIKVIEQSDVPITELTFIGGSFCFNDADKALLAKAAAISGKKENADVC